MLDVTVNQIHKRFNGQSSWALEDVNLEVEKGELFGLIGPDGAGKTSLFRILTTLLLPDKGNATVNGHDVVKGYKEIRKIVGYMPGRFSLYQDLSVEENLQFFATLFNTSIAANYHLIEDIYVQLEPFKTRRAGKLSGGMKQKLALCCALIHRPEVLFLDEPTTDVDTVSRKEFWEILQKLKKEGITILVSTPYMDEAKLCERIALIQDGKIMDIDTPGSIIQAYPDPLFAIKSRNMSKLLKDLRTLHQTQSVHSFGDYHHITLKETSQENLLELLDQLNTLNHKGIHIEEIDPTIEDCFIQLLTDKS